MVVWHKKFDGKTAVAAAIMLAMAFHLLTTDSADGKKDEDVKNDRYLLLDPRVVAAAQNAQLTLGVVEKHPANPLFGEDEAWEKRYDNLYARVIYDEEEQLYKCWYMPFIIDNSAKGMTHEERERTPYRSPEDRDEGICYAFSEDGLHWEKPKLGLVEFLGNSENNIAVRGPHGASVFKDLHDPDPARRFKALMIGHTTGRQMLAVAFSADGVRWSKQIPCPEAGIAWDSANNALWVPERGEYVGFTRISSETKVVVNGQEQGVRAVGRVASKDFLTWTKVEQVFEGEQPHLQIYCMPVFRYQGIYLGLPAIYNTETDRTHTELAWSQDTIQWHRVCPGSPLIPQGSARDDYDWGCVYPAANPVFLDEEIRLYYGASDGPHSGWRLGSFCLATLRPDGFAGYEPISADVPAVIKTRPVSGYFASLRITADVREGGSVRAAVVDEHGVPIVEGEPIHNSVTESSVAWSAGWDPTAVMGTNVRFRFELHNAKLYSFNCN
ncbi:MAG: hypothetical protein OXN17_18005 [Candidatus Poribacteria bacterium]|nr:hypothetical protein [Candidatus Poribacteria bacterium]